MFSGSFRFAVGLVVVLSVALPARAGLLGPAGDYDAFIFGNLDAVGGDTEGRLAVGQNATMYYYSVGAHLPNSNGSLDYLVVGGDLNAVGHWQVFGGNTKYGGNLLSSPSAVTPNTVTAGKPLDFYPIQTQMQSLSANLATLTDNGTASYKWSTLYLTATDPLLNVITVNPAEWASASDRQITAPAGSTLIINVPGVTNSMSGGLALHGIARENVLYNFYESATINSSSIAVLGSVLGPYATLNISGGSIDGNAVLLNAYQRNGGEFHNHPFQGTPEPASVSLVLLAGGLISRRRQRSS